MSGESKILNTETSLMNYQHAWCISGGRKMLRRLVLQIIDIIGACQVKVKCSKRIQA